MISALFLGKPNFGKHQALIKIFVNPQFFLFDLEMSQNVEPTQWSQSVQISKGVGTSEVRVLTFGLSSVFANQKRKEKKERKKETRKELILLAFITGNSSLEALLEGLFAQIHIDLS